MGKHINQYIEASGAGALTKEKFEKLKSEIGQVSQNSKIASLQIKDKILKSFKRRNNGTFYSHQNYTAKDVLNSGAGNCLGLPMLVGSMLGEFGFNPQYKLIVTPKDLVYRLESDYFNAIKEEIRYDKPILASEKEDSLYRFTPLEHLVVNVDGNLIETTSEENIISEGESARDVTFEQALGLIYKDRAVDAITSGDLKKASDLSDKGLKLWKDNREIYRLMALIGLEKLDSKIYDDAVKKYLKLDGNDSLYHFNRFLFTKDINSLEKALEIYPSFAPAISNKARLLSKKNPQEAKFLFSLSSHLYSNSGILDFGDFYIENAEELIKLFGKDKIMDIMKNFEQEKWGNLNYHIEMFKLSGNKSHLEEAKECV